jgi:hypothetical protein
VYQGFEATQGIIQQYAEPKVLYAGIQLQVLLSNFTIDCEYCCQRRTIGWWQVRHIRVFVMKASMGVIVANAQKNFS